MNHCLKIKKIFIPLLLLSIIVLGTLTVYRPPNPSVVVAHAQKAASNVPYIGLNMRGLYTTDSQIKDASPKTLPVNYYEDSFRLMSQAGMDHVRYVFYWEAYEKNPSLFMSEITTAAKAADKWGIKVIYDNHQFHTSSWLEPGRGNGFPISLFKNNSTAYPEGGGGAPKYQSAKVWWHDLWNRSIKDTNGTDAWTRQANFLKTIVNAVDKFPSTLGYEILNEPQVHYSDEWQKIGNYNTFITNELRSLTQKTIFFSQQIPAGTKDPPENMAKMAPANKTNVIFKVSGGYGVPAPGNYFDKRFTLYLKTAQLMGLPLYIGEWNKQEREQVTDPQHRTTFEVVHRSQSDINQTEANLIVQRFKEGKVWGMAFWIWNFQKDTRPNFNLINITDTGTIQPTKYFEIVKNAYANAFGNTINNANADGNTINYDNLY